MVQLLVFGGLPEGVAILPLVSLSSEVGRTNLLGDRSPQLATHERKLLALASVPMRNSDSFCLTKRQMAPIAATDSS